ncbi:MAG: hypothetical protein JWN60_1443 [Acidobacteria bacterium]|nr:hypothetical protein [Acidobacteriota bacterium]
MNTQTTDCNLKESVHTLLAEIVDYAGLFPPSQISMAEAVSNYAAYKKSNHKWMLGRFVVAVARLDEFIEQADKYLAGGEENVWRLSVLAGEDVYDSVRRVDRFNAQNSSRVLCDALEVKVTTVSEIENTVSILPPSLTTYFEITPDRMLAETVSTLAILGQRAKIRTGGLTADAFPSSSEVIRFIRTCLAANVPFKATAGLHHPLRCFKPLTYAPDAPSGVMHGFLNLFLATGFARQGFRTNILEGLLEDEFPESFEFFDSAVTWHRDYILTVQQIALMRRRNIISFGSCSFEEPIADLREMGIL